MPNPQHTFLIYADIVGYTALLKTNKEEAFAKLEHFRSVFQEQTKGCQGTVLQLHQDYAIAQFDEAATALTCAEKIQLIFRTEPEVPVRMGVHAGNVITEKGNTFGQGLLELNQIEKIAIAGSIVLSEVVQEQLADQAQFNFQRLGSLTLKKTENPIELFALVNEALALPAPLIDFRKEQKKAKQQNWWRALQMFAGYLVAAWTLLQFIDWILTRYQISPYWTDIFLWIFVGIIPSLLIYLLHQERFHQRRLRRREMIIIPLNILLVFGSLTVAYGGSDLGSILKKVNFTDIDGQQISQTIVKPEFVQSAPIFSFEQLEGPDSTKWIGDLLKYTINLDVKQDKYINTWWTNAAGETDKINIAKPANGAYYIDGRYRILSDGFEIIPTLRDKRNGAIETERIFRGKDYFNLIDSISIYLRQEMGITPFQMKQSIDLDLKDYMTDNFQALKYYALTGFKNFDKAIQLDSTLSMAAAEYAHRYYNGPRGQLESKHLIELAMRHRKRLPYEHQIWVMLKKYQISGEWEKADKLIALQLELDPNNTKTYEDALYFYENTGQVEKAHTMASNYYDKFQSNNINLHQLWLAMRMGELGQAEKGLKKLVEQFPQNLSYLNVLVEVYIHQQKLDLAQETIERIMLINPEAEEALSLSLNVISYMKKNPDFNKNLQTFAGFFRSQSSEMITERKVSNNGVFGRTENTPGWYQFPDGENRIIRGDAFGNIRKIEYLKNSTGAVYAQKDRRNNVYWKQDSTIWNAEELLRSRDYEQARIAYTTAIAQHPEHFYLKEALNHLDYIQSKSEAEIEEQYLRFVGNYGEVRIWVEGGQLFYKRPGLRRRILRPISDHEFITLFSYQHKYGFTVENGVVKGMYLYNYNNETEQFEENEDWNYPRTILDD